MPRPLPGGAIQCHCPSFYKQVKITFSIGMHCIIQSGWHEEKSSSGNVVNKVVIERKRIEDQ
jgi:hypothetical protein